MIVRPPTWSVIASLLVASGAAPAQVNNPADNARERATQPAGQGQERPRTLPSFQMPRVVVEGQRASELREEDRIGTYAQPRWTAKRRFGETRIYVRPEGTAAFETWVIPEVPRHGGPTQTKVQYEFEFGLPNRFQVDLYLVSEEQGNDGPLQIVEEKFEVRHALADWGVIPCNPTLYLEWAAKDQSPDAVEGKLLLGDEIASRWHWGTNLVWEQETGGARERSLEVTGGLSYTVSDDLLAVGVETKLAFVSQQNDLDGETTRWLLGPSAQLRPSPQAHLDLAVLFGVNEDAPAAKATIIFGWEF